MFKPPVVLLSGIPGSGKGHFIKRRLRGALVCSADHYFEEGGVYRFNPAKLGEAHGACLHKFTEALTLGPEWGPLPFDAIVVDNTNLTALELAPYVAIANAYGIKPEIITLHVEAKVAHARGKHGVPLRSVERMFDTLERRQLPNFWNASYTEIYAVGAVGEIREVFH